jgi:hypothetical protein
MSLCLYLKFYEKLIDRISKWTNIIDDCIDNNINVYVWIESQQELSHFKNLYKPNNVKYITHNNKKQYNSNIIDLETKITEFQHNVGLKQQTQHCQAHLKSFLLTSEDYILHLDADDMYYTNTNLRDILKLKNYMIENNLEILARPYWILQNRGWSFGFVMQKRTILDKMFIFNYNDLSSEFKGIKFKVINRDIYKVMNLDNYFGMILIDYYKIPIEKLFFHFQKNKKWNDAYDSHNICGFPVEPFYTNYNIIEI